MRRRLIVVIIVAVLATNAIAGCSWREAVAMFVHDAPPAAAGAAKGFASGGPVGAVVGAVLAIIGSGGVRHVERKKLKRKHAGERSALELRIRELEQCLDKARAQPSREG